MDRLLFSGRARQKLGLEPLFLKLDGTLDTTGRQFSKPSAFDVLLLILANPLLATALVAMTWYL